MKRRRFGRSGRGHRAHTSRVLEQWREILWGRVESTRCPETAHRPSRDEVVKTSKVDLTIHVTAKRLDVLRDNAIAVTHHVVGRWLIEDILKPFDRHVCDVDPVDKGLLIFDEPLKDPTMPR